MPIFEALSSVWSAVGELPEEKAADLVAPFLDALGEEGAVDFSQCHSAKDVLSSMADAWSGQKWKVVKTLRWFELTYLLGGTWRV